MDFASCLVYSYICVVACRTLIKNVILWLLAQTHPETEHWEEKILLLLLLLLSLLISNKGIGLRDLTDYISCVWCQKWRSLDTARWLSCHCQTIWLTTHPHPKWVFTAKPFNPPPTWLSCHCQPSPQHTHTHTYAHTAHLGLLRIGAECRNCRLMESKPS